MDFRYLFFVVLVAATSCADLSLDVHIDDENKKNDVALNVVSGKPRTTIDWAESEGVHTVLRRASQMAMIRWTPVGRIPNNHGFFEAGRTITGVPYSSTKQINKYIGLDVSFHSFMTAVHDPYSVLYTEDIGKDPYNGVNCASYYGVVCSTALSYAFDLHVPYPSSFFPKIEGFERIDPINVNDLKVGDVFQNSSHVFMVYRLYKTGNGTVRSIEYFEASWTNAGLKSCSAESLSDRIIKDGLAVYRFKDIDYVLNYEPSEYVPIEQELSKVISYNNELCPNRGDQSVYRSDETIYIDVLDRSFREIVLESESGDEQICLPITGNQNKVGNLLPGFYYAFLQDGTRMSQPVRLVVADPVVRVTIEDRIHVDFSCTIGEPIYCALTNDKGSFKFLHRFSMEEIETGRVDLDLIQGGPLYCKVVFQTPYGTVVNKPILVE